MFRSLVYILLALVLALALGAGSASASGGAATTCVSSLIIFTNPADQGTFSQSGQVTHVRDSGVLGYFYDGVLAGYTLDGAQDIHINTVTNQAQLQGWFLATGPDGSTVTIKYSGHADLNTGAATGSFVTKDGTGQLADFHWSGRISAQLIGPLTFNATDSGICTDAPVA